MPIDHSASAPPTPFSHTSGPQSSPLIIVGEALGKDDALLGQPFIGASGQELTRLLREAGFQRSDFLLTNVFPFLPPDGKIENLWGTKKDLPPDYSAKAVAHGKYLLPAYLPHLTRLHDEITAHPRTLIIAMGNTACWALLGSAGIMSLRGVVTESTLTPGIKVLPTYHPSAVLRQWGWRPIVLADLMKARKESRFPEIVRPERYVLVDPTLEEIEAWIETHAVGAPYLACDIETKNGQITEYGFAASRKHAICIPLVKPGGENYWPHAWQEIRAWNLIERLLTLSCPKIFQNGMYDLFYTAKVGLKVVNPSEDTMLLHHSLFPEMQKGLAFLGSVYTNESSWKLNYRKSKVEEIKADE